MKKWFAYNIMGEKYINRTLRIGDKNMEEKKKSKVGLLIAVILVIAVAAVVVIFVLPKGGAGTPEEAAQKVVEAIADGNDEKIADAYHSKVEPVESMISLYGFYDIDESSIIAKETTKRTTTTEGMKDNYGINCSDAKVMEVSFDATYMGTTEAYITYVSVAKVGGNWFAVMVDAPMPVRLLNN
ncbi:MAG: hypothetical protein IKJ73_00565 [Lachnospiraceae bacterium]|nr:hypothetical protein [Lachnospiraceae bacterium]